MTVVWRLLPARRLERSACPSIQLHAVVVQGRLVAAAAASAALLAITASAATAAPYRARATAAPWRPASAPTRTRAPTGLATTRARWSRATSSSIRSRGSWTVPTATQHSAGQSEASSDWIGIGGGCVDAGCTVTDSTLIQTGTEQDVSSTGAPSYSAWYELVPAPSLTISGMTVSPGDHMHATIAEVGGGLRCLGLSRSRTLTRNESYMHHGPVPIDACDGGVDRGDAARDRHQRGLRGAAEPHESGLHPARPPTARRPTSSPRRRWT